MRPSVLGPIALALPLLAACRFGFDQVTPDEPRLACGMPSQFALTGTLTSLAATATATGYYVLAVDGAAEVHGYAYGFDGDQLAARAADVPVFGGATGTAAAIATGDDVMAAIPYGQPSAGMALVPLDAELAPLGPPQMHLAWYGLDSTIARTADGTLSLLGEQSSGDVAAKLVSPTGSDLGAPHLVVDRSEGVSDPAITASSRGFLVTWSATAPSPNEVHAEILDAQLAATVPVTTINAGAMFDGLDARAGYAEAADLYLFAWSFKPGVGDELWVSLRDSNLVELRSIMLSKTGLAARIVAGQDDFLVVWQDGNFTSGLAAARVGFDGAVAPLTISGNGGRFLGWDVVTRAGQPAVVWLEDGMSPTLWIDPLCN